MVSPALQLRTWLPNPLSMWIFFNHPHTTWFIQYSQKFRFFIRIFYWRREFIQFRQPQSFLTFRKNVIQPTMDIDNHILRLSLSISVHQHCSHCLQFVDTFMVAVTNSFSLALSGPFSILMVTFINYHQHQCNHYHHTHRPVDVIYLCYVFWQ